MRVSDRETKSNRRDMLRTQAKDLGLGFGAVAAGAILASTCGRGLLNLEAGLAELFTAHQVPTPNAFDDTPDAFTTTPYVVQKGVGIRFEPAILHQPRLTPHRPLSTNIIPWNQIEAVNGIALNGNPAFAVEAPQLVWGESVTPGVKAERWLRVRIKQKGVGNERYSFINLGPQTADLVRAIGTSRTEPITFPYKDFKEQGDRWLRADGEVALKKEIGKVTQIGGYSSQLIDIWADSVRQKLDRRLPLHDDKTPYSDLSEKRYAEVEVVSGDLKPGSPVEVWDYPQTQHPWGGANSAQFSIRLGTRVNGLLAINGKLWGAFRVSSVAGELYGPSHRLNDLRGDDVLAIPYTYLLDPSSQKYKDAQKKLHPASLNNRI